VLPILPPPTSVRQTDTRQTDTGKRRCVVLYCYPSVCIASWNYQLLPQTLLSCVALKFSTILTVRHSDTWWTVVPTKAAAVAETSTTMHIKVVIWWIYQLIKSQRQLLMQDICKFAEIGTMIVVFYSTQQKLCLPPDKGNNATFRDPDQHYTKLFGPWKVTPLRLSWHNDSFMTNLSAIFSYHMPVQKFHQNLFITFWVIHGGHADKLTGQTWKSNFFLPCIQRKYPIQLINCDCTTAVGK